MAAVEALREHLNLLAIALQRATVLRAGTSEEPDEEALRASDAHLPGVGWVVGMAACLAFALVGLVLRASHWGALLAAIGATAATAALTCGRGETGLFRASERLQALGAPGQSGVGTLVLVLLLLAKVGVLAAIASLSEPAVLCVLFAGQVVSRLAPLLLARSLAGDVPPRAVQVGAAWCLVPLLLVLAVAGAPALVLAVVAATLACYGMWRLARRQAEPVERDVLAAAQQACELAFYLGAAVGL